MNLKVANLIAVETGILFGLISWLAYSHFPTTGRGTEAGMQESNVAPVKTVAPPSEAINQRLSTVDYNAEREQTRLMAERSASLQSYYRSLATEPSTRSGLANGSVAVETPSYAQVDQEPAAVPSDYLESPQTIIYAPQIVVFSNHRRFANRCRSTPHLNGAPPTITHQCPDRRNSHLNDIRVVSGPNVSTTSPPTGGVRPRETFRQTGVTGSQQKRVAFPGSPGATQRSVSVP
jgi:hypothetical protein